MSELLREGYLSDDVESRLRMNAKQPCQLCMHFQVKQSWVTERVERNCGRVDGNDSTALVLNSIMLRMASSSGVCDLVETL